MKHVTGTLISYYFFCKRRMWLHANDIRFESNSDDVGLGVLIHENSYLHRSDHYTEIEIDGIKIDFYDPKAKVIHEIKKSDSYEEAHKWQVKYYIFVLEQNGMDGVTGLLEYPKLRERSKVILSESDREEIKNTVENIEKIVTSDNCPDRMKMVRCRNCSYFDFCWSEEE